ncbi:MAG: primosomal protein N' (replication factor Y), partial [Myxococcota bacterium]
MSLVVVAEVAISRGPREPLTYSIPPALLPRAVVGCRAAVPLGRTRTTGYITRVSEIAPPGFKLKPMQDVLDDRPLFDAPLLELFRFISGYYFAPLGDVIRTGLPNGLNVKHARIVALTELGKARATLDPVLARLIRGPSPVEQLAVQMSEVLRLRDAGLIELTYELGRPQASARMVRQVSLTGAEPPKALKAGAGPAQLQALLKTEGTLAIPSLKGRISNHSAAVRRLVDLGVAHVEAIQSYRDPWGGATVERDTPPVLTADQRGAVDALRVSLESGAYQGFLLRGVTGSGKTEVYLHALEHALACDRGAIVLVPEIALTPQLAGRFRARFGDKVAVLHSGLSDAERLDQWQLIRQGERPCVVGARSALFAPVPRLGLIVVDEEHEPSFKQDEAPRYHARDMALKRGLTLNATVVLGSATPSLETIANAEAGRLTRVDLPGRIGSRPMPDVQLIDLRETPPVRPEALLSQPLLDGIREVVSRKEQAIIFLNRRGFAACFVCRTCGEVPQCRDCSVSLTFHRAQRRLSCHYCDYVTAVPVHCPVCKTGELMMAGTGTEQVEAVLREELPEARVARMDRDTTRGRALTQLLDKFRNREIDVLVGTQMVAKGHDFPAVTLVGVLMAEQMLRLQDFRAGERTFQLITQVAGRAGRHERPGRVLVQTFAPDHHSLQCALQHDVATFVKRELQLRSLRGFPPFGYACLLRLDHPKMEVARDAAGRTARWIGQALDHAVVEVIGPNPAIIERVKGRS